MASASDGPVCLVGIDPGLVNTGVVAIDIDPEHETVDVRHAVVSGSLTDQLKIIVALLSMLDADSHVFIEAFRERGNMYSQDTQMRAMLTELKRLVPRASVIDNTGVKKIITPHVASAFGVVRFATKTHHQDLESAARIALYGAVKDERLNRLVFKVVEPCSRGQGWTVRHSTII